MFGELPPPLANLSISTSDDQEDFRQSAVEHISVLFGRISTVLAHACAYMSQVARYSIRVSTISSTPTLLYKWNACVEESGLLASSAAHYRGVWWVSNAPSPRSRRRGQYCCCTGEIWSHYLYPSNHYKFAQGEDLHSRWVVSGTRRARSYVSGQQVDAIYHRFVVVPTPPYTSLDQGHLSRSHAVSYFLQKHCLSPAPRSIRRVVLFTRCAHECLVRDGPTSIAFTPSPLHWSLHRLTTTALGTHCFPYSHPL